MEWKIVDKSYVEERMEKGRANINDRLQSFMMKFVRKMNREENGSQIQH